VTHFDVKPLGPIALSAKLGVSQPAPHQRYLSVAKNLAAGLPTLASAGSACNVPLAFLAAQVTETALKAFLLKSVPSQVLASSKDRHRIDSLWGQAVKLGLPLAATPTPAIHLLVKLHQKPYPLRYSDENTTRLLALPESNLLATEVEHVLQVVSASM
jgi:hypothetical protein